MYIYKYIYIYIGNLEIMYLVDKPEDSSKKDLVFTDSTFDNLNMKK